VVAEPEVLDDQQLDVTPFPPPRVERPLDGGRRIDPARTRLFGQALAEGFRARGYEVEVAPPDAAQRSLEAALGAAKTDVVVVARAVPLERLYVLEERVEAQLVDPTGDGTGVRLPTAPTPARRTPGEIHLAQLFTYDRATGARLLSDQLPGLPNDGALRPDTPLLSYGVAGEEAAGLEGEALAEVALGRLASALLADYPSARAGTQAGRARLDALDLAAEVRRERFFDEDHFVVEVGTGWTVETVGGTSRLPAGGMEAAGDELPGLDTGAFAPDGAFRAIQGRVSWVAAGGLSLNGVLLYGAIPGDYQRRVFQDAPTDAGEDRLATQTIEGGDIIGGGAGVGQLVPLSDGLFLHPSALLFAEVWSFDLSPASTFEDGDHTRLGLEGRIDLWLVPGGGPLLFRAGLHARGGFDLAGPAFGGGGASLGAGVLF
jgi:hypothetical protein